MLALTLVAAACTKSTKTKVPAAEIRPALEATAEQLLERYNQQARAVRSLNAAVELNPVAGSTYSGVIEDYRDVRGFILAQRPSNIRVIGQAPVVAKNIFDMVSDGETFRIFIPSKNKFITGPAEFERPSQKPIENLRPQHLLDALFWPEIPAGLMVLNEEFQPSSSGMRRAALRPGQRVTAPVKRRPRPATGLPASSGGRSRVVRARVVAASADLP